MEFSQIHYDRHTICWGHGNNLVGPQLLARIQLREPTKKEDKEELKDYKRAEEIFNTYVKKGNDLKLAEMVQIKKSQLK